MIMHYPLLISFLVALAASIPAFCQVKAYEEKITMPTWEIGPAQVHSLYPDATGRGERHLPLHP